MVGVLVCDRDQKESRLLCEDCREQAALLDDQELRLETVPDGGALSSALEQERLVDLLYYEFERGQSLSNLRDFRRACGDAMVMLITDTGVSPLEYLRPGIAPDALLLRPLERTQLHRINREFMETFFERFGSNDADSSFIVDTREEKLFLPFSRIYYFEAREKKLYVRVRNEEYAFYDTIERLAERLPKTFCRCHRSYIVNSAKIVRFLPGEGYIELADGLGVPVSRRYKAALKGGKNGT